MKKRKSIFVKIALILMPFVLALEIIALLLTYGITYDNNLHSSEKLLNNAVNTVLEICESHNIETADKTQEGKTLSDMCRVFGITYIYVLKPDLNKVTKEYIAIGFGEDALENAKETRYAGVVVDGPLNKEQGEAYYGDKDGVIRHESNQFGDTLVCYMPYTRYFDIEKDKYVEYDSRYLIGAEISLTAVNESFKRRFMFLAALILLLTLLMLGIFGLILYFKITKPLRKISKRMSSYVTDREQGFEKLPVKGGDELAMMASSFNTMTDDIDRYIGDIDTLTREKHTREAELNIARNIQLGLLPPDREITDSYIINAYMLSARDVGGDLYDYRVLEDGNVYFAIADVSGKGVAASLFMSRAITLLSQLAQEGCSPARTLEEYNKFLAAQNPGGLFITTFVAIYDPKTSVLTYSNAGHNFPYVLSEKLTVLDDGHGIAAGLFEDEIYTDASVKMKPGDSLFMFTDGVNEAKNADDKLYSTKRLEEKLTGCIKEKNNDILKSVLDDLNRFTKGAEQNDDITMLSFRLYPETVLNLKMNKNELVNIRRSIDSLDVGDYLRKTMYLAAEEIFVNICSYSYNSTGSVEFKIIQGSQIEFVFTDSGMKFDPTADVLKIEDYDHDNAIGGLGRYLAFSFADDYSYEYTGGKNILKLYFNYEVNENDDNENA